MDLQELFRSCRTGDLEKLKYLVEERDIMVNVRDKWDSTPLYYACLCGHYDVVEYLLRLGAKCQANTFDGERCLYSALNPEIKQLLLDVKMVSSNLIRRDPYQEFLRKLFESGDHSDFVFNVHGEKMRLHRCILAARSSFFREKFNGNWRYKDSIIIRNSRVNPVAFEALMRYIYTGGLELPSELKEDLAILASNCGLISLLEKIEIFCKKSRLFESAKPGTRVTNIVIEPSSDCAELKEDFRELCFHAMQQEGTAMSLAALSDILFEVESSKFPCHQAFFCARSEYFATVLHSPLVKRKSITDTLDCIKLKFFNVPTFKCIIAHVYCEDVKLDGETVQDVLMLADFCLLPGLKRQCGLFMAQNLDTQNVCAALRAARLLELPRLENQCYKFMADHLDQLIDDCGFRQIVVEDAGSVRCRQDCDSIEVIDSVRYNLIFATLDEASEKFSMIDALLEELNLNA
uniref:BTB domain-containing protein n=1 Tax=Trichuris muris TaxID=70415 RepID=A0A5S6R5G3_TRIMR